MLAMAADGVDLADPAAVRTWLAGAAAGPLDAAEDEDFDEDVEYVTLKELYGLPDRLPPLRLPLDAELATAARASRLLARAAALADWVGEDREVTESGELTGPDCRDAAQALGIEVPDTASGLTDVPELCHLWDLAESIELIEIDEGHAGPGEARAAWPDGEDGDVLDVWATALAVTMTSLDLDAELDRDIEVDFYGAGGAVLMTLFLTRNAGVPYAELNGL